MTWFKVLSLTISLLVLAATFGYQSSFFFYGLYIPFEFFIGVWILIKGVKNQEQATIAAV